MLLHSGNEGGSAVVSRMDGAAFYAAARSHVATLEQGGRMPPHGEQRMASVPHVQWALDGHGSVCDCA